MIILSLAGMYAKARLNQLDDWFVSNIIGYVLFRSTSAVTVGARLRLRGFPFIEISPLSSVRIGRDVVISSKVYSNSLGAISPSIIKVFHCSFLSIGNNVGLSSVRISCCHSILIGDNVLVGADCIITDSDAHPIKPKDRADSTKIRTSPIIIEDDVFIGAKCIILKGSHVGRGSVIGAGSVVAGKIPPNCIAVGIPARPIKFHSD
jgi:acetyltransferase-like isoleucine patch superfamily enzyme